MQLDITHLQREIESRESAITQARREAEQQLSIAKSEQQTAEAAGSTPNPYTQSQATQFEEKADSLQRELDDLVAQKTQAEQHLAALEGQKTQLVSTHEAEISRINNEIAKLHDTISPQEHQIQDHERGIGSARRDAVLQLSLAGSEQSAAEDAGTQPGSFFQLQAARLEAKARGLEDERDSLVAQKNQNEQRLSELEGQKVQLVNNYEAELRRLDDEIIRTRGTSMMV